LIFANPKSLRELEDGLGFPAYQVMVKIFLILITFNVAQKGASFG